MVNVSTIIAARRSLGSALRRTITRGVLRAKSGNLERFELILVRSKSVDNIIVCSVLCAGARNTFLSRSTLFCINSFLSSTAADWEENTKLPARYVTAAN